MFSASRRVILPNAQIYIYVGILDVGTMCTIQLSAYPHVSCMLSRKIYNICDS